MELQREITQDREIIHHIEVLLPTVDAAMFQIRELLDALKMEDAKVLLRDSAEAIKSVSGKLLLFPLVENQGLICAVRHLREAIVYMADVSQAQDLVRMRTVLEELLLPAYERWKEEVLAALTGSALRYLQN